MTDAAILDDLTELMRDLFDDDGLVVGPQTKAEDVPGWDSQAHIQLVVAAEQRFGVRFRTSELESLHDVGELVSLISAKQNS